MSSFECGGQCCTDFTLNNSPENFGRGYVQILARHRAGEALTENERDHLYIGDMLVRIDEDDEGWPRYTCRHFVQSSGRCGAYDQRPAMCRNYPDYGNPLAQPCTWCGFKGDSCNSPVTSGMSAH